MLSQLPLAISWMMWTHETYEIDNISFANIAGHLTIFLIFMDFWPLSEVNFANK